jgi:uncharacterized protein (DUF1697 family)
MTTYIALLRGVNVGGNQLKMERLRAICASLGFENARTYLQSGNVVFEANGSSSKVVKALEEKLAGETRLPVRVLVRSGSDLKRLIAKNPFLKSNSVDRARLHVTFLSESPAAAALKRLGALDASQDEFRAAGTEIYLHCPTGYGRSKLSNNNLERLLSLTGTTRNWNTVNTLAEMAFA